MEIIYFPGNLIFIHIFFELPIVLPIVLPIGIANGITIPHLGDFCAKFSVPTLCHSDIVSFRHCVLPTLCPLEVVGQVAVEPPPGG